MTTYTPRLFNYHRRFDEALSRGAVYFPGESISKFGLQKANVIPVMVAKDAGQFEWGEIVCLDANGKGRKVTDTDTADNFLGVVDRNASGTMGVLDMQVMGMAPRLTLSVYAGKRQGVVAVPLQTVNTYDDSTGAVTGTTQPVVGGQVYVRIAESAGNPDLPIGGIETHAIAGETVEWTDVTFQSGVMYPYKEQKFTDSDSPTNAVVGIEL